MDIFKRTVFSIAVTASLVACGGGGDSSTNVPPIVNAAPIANAGTLQSTLTGTVISLDGSASTDANSDVLTYSWVLTSKPVGSMAVLSNINSPKPTFTADIAGDYVATLIVNDGKINSAASNVTIKASVTNAAPVANAGLLQNIVAGSIVTLDGSTSTDANSDALIYSWVLTSKPVGSVAVLSNINSPKPTFTADIAGDYVATLIVNDGKTNSAASNVTIKASVTNAAPVANAGLLQNIVTGSIVTLDGNASTDANSDALTYSWVLTSKPVGSVAVLSNINSPKPTFTADIAGDYVATLIVNDGKINSEASSVTIKASVTNAAPVANAGLLQNIVAGSIVTLDGSASTDANSDALTYSWVLTSKPVGSVAVLSNINSPKPTFTADIEGNYVATLIVNDGVANSDSNTVVVTAISTLKTLYESSRKTFTKSVLETTEMFNQRAEAALLKAYSSVSADTDSVVVTYNADTQKANIKFNFGCSIPGKAVVCYSGTGIIMSQETSASSVLKSRYTTLHLFSPLNIPVNLSSDGLDVNIPLTDAPDLVGHKFKIIVDFKLDGSTPIDVNMFNSIMPSTSYSDYSSTNGYKYIFVYNSVKAYIAKMSFISTTTGKTLAIYSF